MQKSKLLFPIRLDLCQKNVLIAADADEGNCVRTLFPLTEMLLPCAGQLFVLIPVLEKAQRAHIEAVFRARFGGESLILLTQAYSRGALQGIDLVFSLSAVAAWNDDLHAVCRTLGIPIYIEGQPERCDFFLQEGSTV